MVVLCWIVSRCCLLTDLVLLPCMACALRCAAADSACPSPPGKPSRLLHPAARRAVRPIAPGEEITIAYVELGATRWERRSSLLAQYYFDLDAPQPEASGSGCEPYVGAAAELQLPLAATTPAAAAAGSTQHGQVPSGDTAAATPAASRSAAQPQQVLQLSDTTQLRLYCSASPPWPCDARDRELTAVHWAGGQLLRGRAAYVRLHLLRKAWHLLSEGSCSELAHAGTCWHRTLQWWCQMLLLLSLASYFAPC